MQSENFLDATHRVTFHSATMPLASLAVVPYLPVAFFASKPVLSWLPKCPECAPTLRRNARPR